jgi:peptide/nickel transport system substrate-binding protein
MKHKQLTRSSFLKGLILLAIAVVLTVHTPLATATPASAPAEVQLTELNAGIISANVVAPLPRDETLYFNGQQSGSVVGWNPYSNNMNNALAIAQQDNARVTVWETPYLYNMLDGKQYPLLAEGDYTWNDDRTEITFTIKSAAHWSDGTPVTAEDVAYTWDTHVKYNTYVGAAAPAYIEDVVAVGDRTVVVKAKLDNEDKAINPLLVAAYLSSNYVIQKAWTQTLEARTGGDAEALKADTGEDFVASGPYMKYLADDTEVVLIRDDNYWGQDASMWGKLPAPKYLAHIIYAGNDAGLAAFKAGEVDVSQQFIPNVQDLWLVDHLPISTYLPNAPYGIGASFPTAYYNLNSYGLDNVVIRKAIAIAVDYDMIVADAMTNQSATFTQVPRSLMNPTPGEQALYDHAAVADLQWAGNDIEGAKALLNAADIVDTDEDGWREYNGQTLHYVATCPNGWLDWQAAIEVVAAVGEEIGIDITTDYPEWSEYQTVVTNWPLPEEGYDIFMMWSDGAGPTQPWGRIRGLMSSEWAGMTSNWMGNWGGYVNPAADALIQAIPGETDPAQLKADFTELTRIYLTDIPSFTTMYRPQSFHSVNESVWTNFPHQGDGTNPPVPPLNLTDGWSIAGLYNITPVVTHASKSVTPTEDVSPGGTVTYTIVLSNSGDGPATDVVMTDTLPSEIDFGGWVFEGSASVPGPTGGEIVWGPWTIESGTTITYVFTATLKTGSAYFGIPVTNTVEFVSINAGSGYCEAVFNSKEGTQFIYLPLVVRN